jgi:hypothetical protein
MRRPGGTREGAQPRLTAQASDQITDDEKGARKTVPEAPRAHPPRRAPGAARGGWGLLGARPMWGRGGGGRGRARRVWIRGRARYHKGRGRGEGARSSAMPRGALAGARGAAGVTLSKGWGPTSWTASVRCGAAFWAWAAPAEAEGEPTPAGRLGANRGPGGADLSTAFTQARAGRAGGGRGTPPSRTHAAGACAGGLGRRGPTGDSAWVRGGRNNGIGGGRAPSQRGNTKRERGERLGPTPVLCDGGRATAGNARAPRAPPATAGSGAGRWGAA